MAGRQPRRREDEEKQVIGEAWLAVASELEDELRRTDPDVKIRAEIDAGGLVRFQAAVAKPHRKLARAACRRYEAKANQTCEHCGGQVSSVGAGLVLTVLCPDCIE